MNNIQKMGDTIKMLGPIIVIMIVLTVILYLISPYVMNAAFGGGGNMTHEGYDGGVYNDEGRYQPDSSYVPRPVTSYYTELETPVLISLHYTNWCGYCKKMWPSWNRAKKLGEGMPNLTFVENDEDEKPTPGVKSFPTIVKYAGGKARVYEGRADAAKIMEFAMSPFQVDTYGHM